MKRLFSIIILLTAALPSLGQTTPQKVIFTIDYGTEIFSRSPETGRFSRESLAFASTYINAHRADGAALINFGDGRHSSALRQSVAGFLKYDTLELPSTIYVAEKTTLAALKRIRGAAVVIAKTGEAAAGVSSFVNLRGDTLTLVNFGDSPGKFVGVRSAEGDIKLVDITVFYEDRNFTRNFEGEYSALREYYTKPLLQLGDTLSSRQHYFGVSDYAELFHRFQAETTGADISFFAPQRADDMIAGEISRSGLYIRDSALVVISLTGREITAIMERIASGWFRRAGKPEDDLLNVHVYGGKTYPYSACYSACGFDYTVNVMHKRGDMVRTSLDPVRIYTVVCSDRFVRYAGITDFTLCGNYKELMCSWLEKQTLPLPPPRNNWKIIPEEWALEAKKREMWELF